MISLRTYVLLQLLAAVLRITTASPIPERQPGDPLPFDPTKDAVGPNLVTLDLCTLPDQKGTCQLNMHPKRDTCITIADTFDVGSLLMGDKMVCTLYQDDKCRGEFRKVDENVRDMHVLMDYAGNNSATRRKMQSFKCKAKTYLKDNNGKLPSGMDAMDSL